MNADRKEVEAFRERIGAQMLSCCGPIFLVPRIDTLPAEMIDVGTFSLIRTPSHWLLVTCDHVWQKYKETRKTHPDAALCVNLGGVESSIAFDDPLRQFIASDPELDLAVFEFHPENLRAGKMAIKHQKNWFPVPTWPTPKPVAGDYIFLMGFPARRVKTDGMICKFVTTPLLFKITYVSEREILILNEGNNVEVFNDIKHELGGLSGSPAYTLGENGGSLVGFVKSGYKPLPGDERDNDSIFSGSLKLTHACFLKPDGTLITV